MRPILGSRVCRPTQLALGQRTPTRARRQSLPCRRRRLPSGPSLRAEDGGHGHRDGHGSSDRPCVPRTALSPGGSEQGREGQGDGHGGRGFDRHDERFVRAFRVLQQAAAERAQEVRDRIEPGQALAELRGMILGLAADHGLWYFVDGAPGRQEPFVRDDAKVGRNDPCPCGSGKKFKKCCGKAASGASA